MGDGQVVVVVLLSECVCGWVGGVGEGGGGGGGVRRIEAGVTSSSATSGLWGQCTIEPALKRRGN